MTSPPLDSTDNRQRRAWHDITAIRQHTVGRRRTWHAIIAFGQHTRSNDVGRGVQSLPLCSTHGGMTSGVACHHRLWAAHTVEQRRAWHAIIALGRQTRSNDVRRGMPSSPLGSTNGRTMSGVTCHHRLWTTHIVERRRAWHAIIAFGQHTRSNDVGRGMPSCLWEAYTGKRRRAWYDITAFGHHTRSNVVGHDMPSSP